VHRREDGFTLIELVVVMLIIGILVSFALAMHYGARERASDAAAKSNIRTAVPAFEMYYADNGAYTGMTLARLRRSYSRGLRVTVVAARATAYCVRANVGGRIWYLAGPGGAITRTRCR
jgi:general secretion pathway protein G